MTQLSKDLSPGVDQFGNPTGTLFDGLQTLLAESRARDMTIHALQASVNTLFAAINARLPGGGAGGTLSEVSLGLPYLWFAHRRLPFVFAATEAVENLFDKQRQEQEQVLRAVAAGKSLWGSDPNDCTPLWFVNPRSVDLSDDIKGERLRFIEAMKEATAINIQSKHASPSCYPEPEQNKIQSTTCRSYYRPRRRVQETAHARSDDHDRGSREVAEGEAGPRTADRRSVHVLRQTEEPDGGTGMVENSQGFTMPNCSTIFF